MDSEHEENRTEHENDSEITRENTPIIGSIPTISSKHPHSSRHPKSSQHRPFKSQTKDSIENSSLREINLHTSNNKRLSPDDGTALGHQSECGGDTSKRPRNGSYSGGVTAKGFQTTPSKSPGSLFGKVMNRVLSPPYDHVVKPARDRPQNILSPTAQADNTKELPITQVFPSQKSNVSKQIKNKISNKKKRNRFSLLPRNKSKNSNNNHNNNMNLKKSFESVSQSIKVSNSVPAPEFMEKEHILSQKSNLSTASSEIGDGNSVLNVLNNLYDDGNKYQQQDENSFNFPTHLEDEEEEHEDFWHEAQLFRNTTTPRTSYAVKKRNHKHKNMIDWNIKHKISIEYDPNGQPIFNNNNYYLLRNIAIRAIGNTDTEAFVQECKNANVRYSDLLWQSGLYYWQYPEHPFDYFDKSNKTQKTGSNRIPSITGYKYGSVSSKQSNPKSEHPIITQLQQLLKQNATKSFSLSPYGSHMENYSMEKRTETWQKAFQDMYFTWISKIDQFVSDNKRHNNGSSGQNVDIHSLPCFYCVQKQELSSPTNSSRKTSTGSSTSRSSKQAHHVDNNNNKNGTNKSLSSYHRVILFRTSHTNPDLAKPVVLLSNISTGFANQLLAMGIHLYNYTPSQQQPINLNPKHSGSQSTSNNFFHHDNSLSAQYSSLSNIAATRSNYPNKSDEGTKENAMDENHKRELEELRFASALDYTAPGGEITVQIHPTSATTSFSQTRAAHINASLNDLPTPVIIYGSKDVHTFYEAFLNVACPSLSTSSSSLSSPTSSDSTPLIVQKDVPVLLTRTLGQTMHTSLSSLTVGKSRSNNNTSRVVEESLEKNNKDTATHNLEIRGMILPCAVSQLLKASALKLLQDKEENQHHISEEHQQEVNNKVDNGGNKIHHLNEDSAHSNDKSEESVGTHYFVANLDPFQSGKNFNGAFQGIESNANESNNGKSLKNDFETKIKEELKCDANFKECNPGEIASMIVWNDTKSNGSIMYRTEKTSK